MYRIILNFERPDPVLVAKFKDIPTCILADAMGNCRAGCVDPKIRNVVPPPKFAGTAFTVKTQESSNLILHKAVTMVMPGDVLVVDAGQNETTAVWGDIFARICKIRKAAGAVIDGTVRDLEESIKLGFPVFARSVSPAPPTHALGSINVPISCGGVVVRPGDVVVCDLDGTVIVPKESLQQVLNKSQLLMQKELEVIMRVEAGEYPLDFLQLTEPINVPEMLVVE